ncbi:c-type cytochrome biogenesis protein CcmI [Roseivivax sp. CAU 1761]
MTLFWILSAGLAIGVAALLGRGLLRGERGETAPAEAFDIRIYRDQLAEVERDRARGVVGAEEAERLRAEVSRRLLAADAQHRSAGASGRAPRRLSLAMAALVALATVGGSLWVYSRLGAPGYGDLGLATRIAEAETARRARPGQADAEAALPARAEAEVSEEYAALVERLRSAVAERPEDPEGLRLLARSEAALGNYRAAYAVQERILALKGEDARAGDYADLGDMMVLAAGGYVSPEAEAAFQKALARDPENGVARYYAGLSYAQTGRPDRAFRIWDALLRASDAEDPWVQPVSEQIGELARRAGVNDYRPPVPQGAAPAGPSEADIAAAAELNAEDRREMIEGMVAGLSQRLATEGGSAEEWARLIGAQAVLGRAEQAMQIYSEAQTVFAGDREALRILREAAQGAGIGQ